MEDQNTEGMFLMSVARLFSETRKFEKDSVYNISFNVIKNESGIGINTIRVTPIGKIEHKQSKPIELTIDDWTSIKKAFKLR